MSNIGKEQVYIIAEAGVNHNGSMERAKALVDTAVDAGANAVKFQAFKAELLVTTTAPKADYQKNLTGQESQFDMLKSLELDRKSHIELQIYCEQKGITFLSSAFDLQSIDELAELNLPLFKIPSGEIVNYPYLKKIAGVGKPVVLSTGLATMDEIASALQVMLDNGLNKDDVTILHCNTEYPTPWQDVNLRAMNTIGKELGVQIGYSDHTLGIEVPIAAVALGARVIEKHFTLDKSLPGPDHQASLDPQELKAMVSGIRNIEQALGAKEKSPSPSELKNKNAVRKSIVARVPIQAGELFSEENLIAKRPGTGLSPMKWDEVIGQPATRNFQPDEFIEL